MQPEHRLSAPAAPEPASRRQRWLVSVARWPLRDDEPRRRDGNYQLLIRADLTG